MKAKKYVNKINLPIKAIKWDGTNESDVAELIGSNKIAAIYDKKYMIINNIIAHPEVACAGDYIIMNCVGEIFTMYERDFISKYKQV